MSVFEVAVIGGGLWGRSLAKAAERAGSRVTLISRRAGGGLPDEVKRSEDYAAARKAKVVILATPTQVVRQVARQLGDHLDGSHYVVHGIRGLVPDEPGPALHTVSEVLREELPSRRLGALGGPALAEDLDAGRPSVLVAASRFPEVTRALTKVFGTPTLRVYSTPDLRGLEWASALVGCLAIGIGFAKGVGLSPGLVAAVLCRSMAEAGRIAAAAGGDERTLLGLAGYGDLLASVEMTAARRSCWAAHWPAAPASSKRCSASALASKAWSSCHASWPSPHPTMCAHRSLTHSSAASAKAPRPAS